MTDYPRLDRHSPGPETLDQLRPDGSKVVGGGLDPRSGRLRDGLQPVAGIGQDDDLLSGNQEPAGVARHPILAVVEAEAGQVPHVFGPDAEVNVDARTRQARPQAGQAAGPGLHVRVGPADAICVARRRGKVGRMGQVGHELRHGLMVASPAAVATPSRPQPARDASTGPRRLNRPR